MSGINLYKRKLLANKRSHIFHTFRLFSDISLEEVLSHCKQKTYSNIMIARIYNLLCVLDWNNIDQFYNKD